MDIMHHRPTSSCASQTTRHLLARPLVALRCHEVRDSEHGDGEPLSGRTVCVRRGSSPPCSILRPFAARPAAPSWERWRRAARAKGWDRRRLPVVRRGARLCSDKGGSTPLEAPPRTSKKPKKQALTQKQGARAWILNSRPEVFWLNVFWLKGFVSSSLVTLLAQGCRAFELTNAPSVVCTRSLQV